MTMKKDAKRTTRKKLTLNRETIRDLTPKKSKVDVVRGGALTNSKEGVIRCN